MHHNTMHLRVQLFTAATISTKCFARRGTLRHREKWVPKARGSKKIAEMLGATCMNVYMCVHVQRHIRAHVQNSGLPKGPVSVSSMPPSPLPLPPTPSSSSSSLQTPMCFLLVPPTGNLSCRDEGGVVYACGRMGYWVGECVIPCFRVKRGEERRESAVGNLLCFPLCGFSACITPFCGASPSSSQ